MTPRFEKSRRAQISAYNVSTVSNSGKSSIMTNRKSTTGFPTSYRWSAYVTPKFCKGRPVAVLFVIAKMCIWSCWTNVSVSSDYIMWVDLLVQWGGGHLHEWHRPGRRTWVLGQLPPRSRSYGPTEDLCPTSLTLSSPVVSNGDTSQYSGPYWSNPLFLIFWHSGTLALRTERQSARVSKKLKNIDGSATHCNKCGLGLYGAERSGRLILSLLEKMWQWQGQTHRLVVEAECVALPSIFFCRRWKEDDGVVDKLRKIRSSKQVSESLCQ